MEVFGATIDWLAKKVFCSQSNAPPESDGDGQSSCVSVGGGWWVENSSQQKPPLAPLPPPSIACSRKVAIRPTDKQFASACLSYDHSFGLLSKDERIYLMAQAKWWFNAFENEGLVKMVDVETSETVK